MTEQDKAGATGDDLDIELGPPEKKSGSCALGTLFLVIVIVALVALWVGVTVHNQKNAAAEAAHQERVAQYNLQARGIGNDIGAAEQSANLGNFGEALQKLDAAAGQLKTLAAMASSSNDEDYANDLLQKRNVVVAAAQAIRQKNQETVALAAQELSRVRTTFGTLMPAATPAPAQEGQTASPAGPGAENSTAPVAPTATPPAPGPAAPPADAYAPPAAPAAPPAGPAPALPGSYGAPAAAGR